MEKQQYEQQINNYFEVISTLVLESRFLYRNPDKFNFNSKERFIKQTELLNSTINLFRFTNEIFTKYMDEKNLVKLIKKEELKLDRLFIWYEQNYIENKKNIDEVLTEIKKQETNHLKECEMYMNILFNNIMNVCLKLNSNFKKNTQIKYISKNNTYVVKLINMLYLYFELLNLFINTFITGVSDEDEKKGKSLESKINDLEKWIQKNISSKTN